MPDQRLAQSRSKTAPMSSRLAPPAALAYFASLAFLAFSGMAGGAVERAEADDPAARAAADAEAPPAQPSADPQQAAVPPANLSEVEQCVLSLINTDRTAAGLSAITARGDLSQKADAHSSTMAAEDRIYHSQLRSGAPQDAEVMGENVGAGFTCEEAHRAFMASPPHAANVMRTDFNFVGLAAVQGKEGLLYVTQVFMKAPVALRLDPVEVVVAEAPPPPPAPAPAPEPSPAPQQAPPSAPEPSPAPVAAPPDRVPARTAAYRSELQ
ncbi:MAG: CAP domain-containing protein [Actinomycetota bacterium]